MAKRLTIDNAANNYENLKALYIDIKFNDFAKLKSIWFVEEVEKLIKNYNDGVCNLTTQELKDVQVMVVKMLKCKNFDNEEKQKLKHLKPEIDNIDIFNISK